MNRFISFSLLRAVFVLQLGGQIDVLLLGLILTHPFLPIPGVPLGFTLDINEGIKHNMLRLPSFYSHLEIHHSWSGSVAVPDGGLLEESVDLQQLFIGESLVDLVADRVHSSLEILF